MTASNKPFRWLLSTFSGLLLAMGFPGSSFPTLSVGWIIPFSLIPLFIAIFSEGSLGSSSHLRARNPKGGTFSPSPKQAAYKLRENLLLCWWCGSVMTFFAFFWTTKPAILFGGIPPIPAYFCFVLYTLIAGSFWALVCSPFLLVTTQSLAHVSLRFLPLTCMAFLATFLELYVPRLFKWTLGSLMHSVVNINQWSSIFGFSVGSFFVFWTNSVLARGFVQRNQKVNFFQKSALLFIAIWVCVLGFGQGRVWYLSPIIEQAPKTRIVFVQPNYTYKDLNTQIKLDAGNLAEPNQEQSLDNLLELSETALKEAISKQPENKPHLLVWPESVAPSEFAWTDSQKKKTQTLVDKYDTPFLVQAIRWNQKELETLGPRLAEVNSISFLLLPETQASPEYSKWFPIPFGETVPFEDWFPSLGVWFRSKVGNTSKVGIGKSFESLSYHPQFRVGPSICFDSILPKLSRLQASKGGASIFINQANFVWMGDSNAGDEFAELDRFRGIENGRSMLLNSNTGPSVAFDPLGRELISKTKLFERTHGVVDMPVLSISTLYSQWGDIPLILFSAISFIILFTWTRNQSRPVMAASTHKSR